MQTFSAVFIIIFGVLDIFSIFIIGKEWVNLRDFKQAFRCDHCNTQMKAIQHDDKCTKCHRHIKNISKQWDHYLTFRVSSIDTKKNRGSFEYKRYILPFKIELTVDIICFIILSSVLFSIVLEVLK